jgi:hypothetical protein
LKTLEVEDEELKMKEEEEEEEEEEEKARIVGIVRRRCQQSSLHQYDLTQGLGTLCAHVVEPEVLDEVGAISWERSVCAHGHGASDTIALSKSVQMMGCVVLEQLRSRSPASISFPLFALPSIVWTASRIVVCVPCHIAFQRVARVVGVLR